jgi:Cu+-exporting ATPase
MDDSGPPVHNGWPTTSGGSRYPTFGLLLSPIIAAAAISLSCVSVIENVLRLRAVRL